MLAAFVVVVVVCFFSLPFFFLFPLKTLLRCSMLFTAGSPRGSTSDHEITAMQTPYQEPDISMLTLFAVIDFLSET